MSDVYATMYEEAQNEFAEVANMQLGSDEHTKTIQAANGMVDRLNKAKEIENEARKLDIEERKLDIEERKLETEKKGRWIAPVVTILTFVGGALVEIWAHCDSKKFEQEGYTQTTESGRSSTRNLLNFTSRKK